MLRFAEAAAPHTQMIAKKRRWTEEDVRRLRLLADAGTGVDIIAKSLERSRASAKLKAHWLELPLAQKAKLSTPSERLKAARVAASASAKRKRSDPSAGKDAGTISDA